MVNYSLALRSLGRNKIVTGVAALSLGLGIGANTAIFSLYDQMLLRALPVPHPEELVNLGAPGPKPGGQSCGSAGSCEEVFSYPMFRDLEKAQNVFTGLAAHVGFEANLGIAGQTPANRRGLFVSGSYFPVLALRAAHGRLLTPDDDRAAGAHPVAVLSHEAWETNFGARPEVIGETIVVNGQSLTIVGVAPSGFRGTSIGQFPTLFVPMTMRPLLSHERDILDSRTYYWAYLFARLKPGVSMEQARVALEGIYRPIITDIELPVQRNLAPNQREEFARKPITVSDGRRGQSEAHTHAVTPILLLFGVTGIVLFIACANIANLLLSRAAGRSMEMGVRLALGASRRQLVAQLLVESCFLALLGGLMAVLIARWTIDVAIASVPSEAAGLVSGMLNIRVLFFAAGLSVTTGVLFGLYPALHSTRPDLITVIRANSGQQSGARTTRRLHTSLVTAQIALSTALLIAAGLFVKSLVNVSRAELGLQVERLITFTVQPELNGDRGRRTLELTDRILQSLAAAPGVTAVTASTVPVLAGSSWGTDVKVEGWDASDGPRPVVRFNEVGVGYFRALGVPLLAGREFQTADVAGAPKVAIVNETFARKFKLGGADGRLAVGKYMAQGSGDSTKLDIQIVGVVRDAKYNNVRAEVPALFVRPIAQDTMVGRMSFYARTTGDPAALVRAVPEMVARLDPTLPVEELKTMVRQVQENTAPERMVGTFAASFAALATLLAAIGLYGVLAYSVSQRTREIGVRMALGATSVQVRTMVLKQVARMTLVGGAIGLAIALAFGRAAASLFYEMTGTDPVVISLSVAVLSLVALGAGYSPAWRASRANPMEALRYE